MMNVAALLVYYATGRHCERRPLPRRYTMRRR